MKIIKYIFPVVLFIFLVAYPIAAQTAMTQTAIAQTESKKLSINIVAELSVADPSKAVQALADYCESAGGYYIKKSDHGISLRLPAGMSGNVEDILKANGILIRYNINTTDIGNEHLVLVKQLDSRKKLLSDYDKLIASSRFSSTLTLERELMTVVTEMENLKGRINKMDNEYKFLKLDIKFFSEEVRRNTPVRSSFDWINRINFYKFVGGNYAE